MQPAHKCYVYQGGDDRWAARHNAGVQPVTAYVCVGVDGPLNMIIKVRFGTRDESH